jgi:hypothetical protein
MEIGQDSAGLLTFICECCLLESLVEAEAQVRVHE